MNIIGGPYETNNSVAGLGSVLIGFTPRPRFTRCLSAGPIPDHGGASFSHNRAGG